MNTDDFYRSAKEYQDKRAGIIADYERTMKEIEDMRGSQRFETESKRARETKEAKIKELKAQYIGSLTKSLQAMEEANGKRELTPPTADELRLIQLLKLKEQPTEKELAAAAQTLKNNALCLAVLNDIGRAQGYMKNYTSYSTEKEMGITDAENIINNLKSNLQDFLDYDTSKAGRIAAQHHADLYGTTGTEKPIPKRATFTTKSECFSELAHIGGDVLETFFAAVDK